MVMWRVAGLVFGMTQKHRVHLGQDKLIEWAPDMKTPRSCAIKHNQIDNDYDAIVGNGA